MSYILDMPRVREKTKTERVASRVTPHCRSIIDTVKHKLGVSESAVIEIAMREYAERHGIQPARPERGEE